METKRENAGEREPDMDFNKAFAETKVPAGTKHTKSYIPQYPRPQLVRNDWENLNGQWAFAFGEDVSVQDAQKGALNGKINVPFSYECEMSGIGDKSIHQKVWYARKIGKREGKRTIIHFEGADYTTDVYVNGVLTGSNTGAYRRFSFDITQYLTNTENTLAVCCTDNNHPAQIRGKQRWEKDNFGCWYVQTTGIYKTVWLEFVNDTYLTGMRLTPSLKDYSLTIDYSVSLPSDETCVTFDVLFDGKLINSVTARANECQNTVSLRLDSAKLTHQVALWSACCPALYDIEVTVKKDGMLVDKAGSYFGLREVGTHDGKFMINSMPAYLKMILDQGYWAQSGITPPDENAIIKDIELTLQMGFNGVRKHQKVEDEQYLYYADIMGLYVWCEMPSPHWHTNTAVKQWADEWLDVVMQNYNHPSIITWVVFNESWGVRNIYENAAQQNIASGLYYMTKSLDTMRPVVSNDGWQHTLSDILTLHHYEQSPEKLASLYDCEHKLVRGGGNGGGQFLPYAKGQSYAGQPIIFSEFGGAAFKKDIKNGWGYGDCVNDEKEFTERFSGLLEAIKDMDISGYCYTQLTDVEQEINGLLGVDRNPKIPLDIIRKIVTGK